MAGQEKDQFEGLGEFAKYFRGNPFFNPESAQQQKQEEAQQPIAEQGKTPTVAAPHVVVAEKAAQQGELEKAINLAIKEAAAKGGKLTREQALKIGEDSGVDLNQYDYCGIQPPHVFYTGDNPPAIKPSGVPLAAVMAGRLDEPAMCADHQVRMAINRKYADKKTNRSEYIGWEAAVINKWEELDAQKAQEQLRQLGYSGIELLTFSEAMRTERGQQPKNRDRQALFFSPGTYSQEEKLRIMAQLREEVLPSTAAKPYVTQARQSDAPTAQAPTTPESGRPGGGIEELLPQSNIEERQLPGGRIEVTKMTLEIAYDGKPANFEQIRYLNSVLQAAGLDCSIDPNDPQKVEFRVRNYLERPEATKEVEDKLRILVLLNHLTAMHVSSSIEDFVNKQVKDPAMRARLLGELPSYMSQQGRISGQQTL